MCGLSLKLALKVGKFLLAILQTLEVPLIYVVKYLLFRSTFYWTVMTGSTIIVMVCVFSIITHRNDLAEQKNDQEERNSFLPNN